MQILLPKTCHEWKLDVIKTEFILTFEDYLDWRSISQKRSPRAPVITSLCGLILVVIGYIVLRPAPGGATAAFGGICLGGGLLIAALSVFLWLFLKRKPHGAKRKEQSTFKRFYRERRVFEADDSGWKYSFGTQENSRQWKDLFGLVRRGQILVFIDTHASHPVPTSALTADQSRALELLVKERIHSEKIFSVGMVATQRDFIAAVAKHNWSNRTAWMIFLYGCGLFTLAFLGMVIADSSQTPLSPWFYASVLILPLIEFARYQSSYLTYTSLSFQDADILDHGICFNLGTLHEIRESRNIRYEWFETAVETKRTFMLYFGKDNFYLVPKTDLTSEQLTKFRQLLKAVPAG
jgi:hypothetical protein